jgi:glycosyltransferase involved in cell wall biosynthesis
MQPRRAQHPFGSGSQEYHNKEIIVVDDGSTDGSRLVIEGYGDKVIAIFKSNGGQASCFNAGFSRATGDIICLLDADDAFLPGKLRHVANIFNTTSAGWCFDRVVTSESPNVPVEPIILTLLDARASMRRGQFPTIPAPTSGLSFRRTLLAQILPMPEADDVVLSDNYLKFAAVHLDKGIIVETPLTFQRLHGANRYSASLNAKALRSQIMVETGYRLALGFPGLKAIGRQLVAGGFALSHTPLPNVVGEIRKRAQENAFGSYGFIRIILTYFKKRIGNYVFRRK